MLAVMFDYSTIRFSEETLQICDNTPLMKLWKRANDKKKTD